MTVVKVEPPELITFASKQLAHHNNLCSIVCHYLELLKEHATRLYKHLTTRHIIQWLKYIDVRTQESNNVAKLLYGISIMLATQIDATLQGKLREKII